MAVHVVGVVAMVAFYLVILLVGLWAARKARRAGHSLTTDDVMLAGRSIGKFLGPITMTATWVGGGFLNGTTEIIVRGGLVKCQAPVGYAISLILVWDVALSKAMLENNAVRSIHAEVAEQYVLEVRPTIPRGFLFAKKMRSAGYVTMLDPFQLRYGRVMGGLLYIPALMGDLFWTAAILAALGATLSVILNLETTISIVVSSVVAVAYTLIGGLYSVAYTDVVQLAFVFIGLWVSFPFALTNEAVADITVNSTQVWLGELKPEYVGTYVDKYLQLIFGGIPWQVYFQRVLASKTVANAQMMSALGTVGCLVMALPAVMMGAVAASTDWNRTSYPGPLPIPDDQLQMMLPMTLQYLCPPAVTFLGLGAVSAAVMSSTDSSMLSAASMFARNVYSAIFRPKASQREILWVTRIAIIVVGALASVIAIGVNSIYELFHLCSDLVYVILFPQLVCVIFVNFSNSYGCIAGYLVGLLFRISGGEPVIGLPPFIDYRITAYGHTVLFPFKTLTMLLSMSSILLVSFVTSYCLRHDIVDKKYDVLKCYHIINDVQVPNESEGIGLTVVENDGDHNPCSS